MLLMQSSAIFVSIAKEREIGADISVASNVTLIMALPLLTRKK
jgi:hypothetical protein